MKYLIDTDICAFYLRGKYKLNFKIVDAGVENCCLSEITILELIYGAKSSNNFEKHIKEIAALSKLFRVLPIKLAYDRFADEKVKLRKSGLLIQDFDLLRGSTAAELGLLTVTNNVRHLKRISDIQIENWTKPKHNQYL